MLKWRKNEWGIDLKNNIRSIDEEQLRSLVASNISFKQVLESLGARIHTSNYKTLQERIAEYSIDTSHFYTRPFMKSSISMKMSANPSDVLIQGVELKTTRLRVWLLAKGLLIEQCAMCGIGSEWNGIPLTLQLDHINGDRKDNRLKNLRLLCPNCHSQTDTFAKAKKPNMYTKSMKKRVKRHCIKCQKGLSFENINGMCSSCFAISRRNQERPPIEVLVNNIKQKGYLGVSREYNVSDNTIRKWIRAAGLDPKDVKINEGKHHGNINQSLNSKTGYRYVSFRKEKKKYCGKFGFGGKSYHTGYHFTAIEAAIAVDKKLLEIVGDSAITNAKLGLI